MDYTKPISTQLYSELSEKSDARSLFQHTVFNTNGNVDLSGIQLAIVGVNEDRLRNSVAGTSEAPDEIRKEFYKLIKPRYEIKLADLGNIEAGNEINDTYFALKQTLGDLFEKKIVCIVLGGMQDLAYSQFAAYEGVKTNLNLMIADNKVDMKTDEENDLNSSHISRIISYPKNFLFNITHIGHQSYFVESESYDAFERMNFDMIRLGNLRHKIADVEPLLRNTDMMVMNMGCVKASDAPGQCDASPNGFSGEEACQITRYAGMSNELSSFGLYDVNPSFDINSQTSKLAAQMIWYFIEGFYNRKYDYPATESKDYMIYRTTSKSGNHEIIFYRNILTDRWWMEVPYPTERSEHSGKFLVPCTYADYQIAMKDEIPDRWMKTYQKLL